MKSAFRATLAAVVIVEAAGGRCNDFLADNGLTDGNPILAAGETLYPKLLAITGSGIGSGTTFG